MYRLVSLAALADAALAWSISMQYHTKRLPVRNSANPICSHPEREMPRGRAVKNVCRSRGNVVFESDSGEEDDATEQKEGVHEYVFRVYCGRDAIRSSRTPRLSCVHEPSAA